MLREVVIRPPETSGLLARLARLAVKSALVLTVVAIALGQWGRPAPGQRTHRPSPPVGISGALLHGLDAGAETRFIDPETGRELTPTRPEGGRLERASYSPWQDRRGAQIVGVWRDKGSQRLEGAFWMRLTELGGEVLDRDPLGVNPSGPPCWFPDRSARIVYAGWDGTLYRHDFEGDDDGRDQAARTRPLAWRTGLPLENVRLTDPSWSTDPRLGGRLVAALFSGDLSNPHSRLLAPRIWWLRLDPDRNEIEAAGPLTPTDDPGTASPEEQRYPVVSATADGGLVLAYLSRPDRTRDDWQLRVVPIALDPRTGEPTASRALERVLATDCLTTVPAFSADGRWVTCLRRRDSQPPSLDRFPVGGAAPPAVAAAE